MVEVRAVKRGPKAVLALKDVRLRPPNRLARRVMEEEMETDPAEPAWFSYEERDPSDLSDISPPKLMVPAPQNNA